jgi:hypothetical protein
MVSARTLAPLALGIAAVALASASCGNWLDLDLDDFCLFDASTSSTRCEGTVLVTTSIDSCSERQTETRSDCASQGLSCVPDYGCAIPCTIDRDCPGGDFCSGGTVCEPDLPDGSHCALDSGPPCAPGLVCMPISLSEAGLSGSLKVDFPWMDGAAGADGGAATDASLDDVDLVEAAAATDAALVEASAAGGMTFGVCGTGG